MRHFADAYFDSHWSVKHHSSTERIAIIDEMFGTEEEVYTTDFSAFESSICLQIEQVLAKVLKEHGLPNCVC